MKNRVSSGIYIGAAPKGAINAARDAVLSILESGREEKTTRLALEAFQHVVEVKNVTVSDCTISGVK